MSVIEAIQASPENIGNILKKQYVIPEYQRPYTWDNDQCDKLWEDIIEAFEEADDLEYFLGTMVLTTNNNKLEIIDGQQRLTTLLLLIRALYDHHQFSQLNKILNVYDELKDELDPTQHRLESLVIDEDFTSLKDILNSKVSNLDETNKFLKNYKNFYDTISIWKNTTSAPILEKFIRFLLNNVKMLPINCGRQDSALKIFQTLNDRGTPLNDIDILKYKLFQHLNTQQEKQYFIEEWNRLDNKENLFRIYMHILRAQNEDFGNVPQLRKYFEEKITKNNHQEVFEDIKKVALFSEFDDSELNFWKSNTIELFPVDLIIYPYYTFMYQYTNIKDGEVILQNNDKQKLIKLIQDMLKFVYRKGIITRSINSIKYDIFKACSSIYQKKLTDIFPKFEEHEKVDFEKHLKNLSSRDKYTKSALSLFHILHERQYETRSNINLNDSHVEHILPRASQNYDKWSLENYNQYINSLGNLTLFEKKLNIQAKNEFLSKKQEKYKESGIIDVVDMCIHEQWTPEEVILRSNKIHERLSNFIFN